MSSKDVRNQLSKKRYNVRLSQIITTFGVGGIMDFIDQPLMTASQKQWQNPNRIYEERLAKKLGVNGFIFPKDSDSEYNVPFVRFPRWYYCPVCKKLKPIEEWEKEYSIKHKKDANGDYMKTPVCTGIEHKFEVPLVAPSILVACKRGHVDDFPWIEWAHRTKGEICSNPRLRLVSDSGSLGLDNMKVECTSCHAENSLKLASSENAFKGKFPIDNKNRYPHGFKCKGHLQWKNEEEECEDEIKMTLRNASNIYFPKIESSLSIPPYSDKINCMIEDSGEFQSLISAKEKKEKKGKLDDFIENDLQDYIEDIAKEIKMEDKIELISYAIHRMLFDDEDSNKESRNDYRYEEYGALNGDVVPLDYISKDFKIEIKNINDYGIKELSKITLVKSLREVRALIGFTRIKPPDNFIMGIESSSEEARLIDIKDENDKWYPGYEVRGEGIFIELNLDLINKWIEENSEIIKRAEVLNDRYNIERNNESKREITPKFILLHTLAHLLIKELSFECGYSSTSLKERIYCDIPADDYDMNGILIYTADSDSEGSLGGLVKQGEPNIFPKIFKKAIKNANWCSYDPVCINSTGQGVRNLNLSACYSCTLLPETSCEEFNTLLDRAMVVGTLENKKIGFFKDYL